MARWREEKLPAQASLDQSRQQGARKATWPQGRAPQAALQARLRSPCLQAQAVSFSLGEQDASPGRRFRCISLAMHAASLRAGGLVHAGNASSGRAAPARGALPAVASAGGRWRISAGSAQSFRNQLLGAGSAASLRQRDITRNVSSERLVASYASPLAQTPYRHVIPCGLCSVPTAPHASRRLRVLGCGIFGIFKHTGNAAAEIYEGLLMLQHRGQDSAGIVTFDGDRFRERKVRQRLRWVHIARIVRLTNGLCVVGGETGQRPG